MNRARGWRRTGASKMQDGRNQIISLGGFVHAASRSRNPHLSLAALMWLVIRHLSGHPAAATMVPLRYVNFVVAVHPNAEWYRRSVAYRGLRSGCVVGNLGRTEYVGSNLDIESSDEVCAHVMAQVAGRQK